MADGCQGDVIRPVPRVRQGLRPMADFEQAGGACVDLILAEVKASQMTTDDVLQSLSKIVCKQTLLFH